MVLLLPDVMCRAPGWAGRGGGVKGREGLGTSGGLLVESSTLHLSAPLRTRATTVAAGT